MTNLDKLNKKVHELNYVDSGRAAIPKTHQNRKQGRELAKKIRKNIESYQDEIGPQQHPNLQAQ